MKVSFALAALCVSALCLSTLAAVTDNAISPIVDAQTGYLLGGSKNRKWLSAAETAKALQGNEKYRVYGLSKKLGDTTGSKPRTDEAPCEETQWVTLKRNYNGVLAVGGNWNPLPRAPRPQNTSQKIYREEVRKILVKNGIKKPNVVVSQLWRVDLEGDGVEEVLLSATNYAGQKIGPNNISPNAKAGEYSLVLMRKIVKGKVQTVTLAQEIYPADKTFNAPSVYRLAGVLDANGDGKMEIILNSRYYEGDATGLHEVTGAKVTNVLDAGCGA